MVNKKSIDDTHEWRKLAHFREGDYIRGLGHEMLVTRVNTEYGTTRLLYVHDKEEKVLVDKAIAEYIGRKENRCDSTKSQNWSKELTCSSFFCVSKSDLKSVV